MNRHRDNWSVMGLEPLGTSQLSQDYEKMRQQLRVMIGKHGIDEVLKEVRKIIDID